MLLAITTEYRECILFVRLEGNLVKETVHSLELALAPWMEEGIEKIVFNMHELMHIDNSGIDSILKYSNIHSLICGINKKINRRLRSSSVLKNIYEISDELNAIKVMKWRL